MSLRNVASGTVISETYLAIPTSVGTIGPKFPNTDDGWDAAIDHARSLIDNAHSEIAREALSSTLAIDLRWVLDEPDGRGMDTLIERHKIADVRKTIRR